jgi:hypothetical protein
MAYEKQPQACLTDEQDSPAEDWQAKVESLQKTVCFLLIKNQKMRMALSAEKGNFKFEDLL